VEGSYAEMVWGLMLGFFMGLIVLFWFKEATFSRRQQMGEFLERKRRGRRKEEGGRRMSGMD